MPSVEVDVVPGRDYSYKITIISTRTTFGRENDATRLFGRMARVKPRGEVSNISQKSFEQEVGESNFKFS